jgi:hypothetical protein
MNKGNMTGIVGNIFSLGKYINQIAIRNNNGVLQGQNHGEDWQNLLGQSPQYPITSVDVNYSILTSDQIVLCTSGTLGITVTLPTASSMTGKQVTIKKIDSGDGGLTVEGNGVETVDGTLNRVLASRYSFMTVLSDGVSWHIIGGTFWN